ncbi:lipase 3 [Folsomia candida]|uniref:lipase 3 n=1 Tax=Folsomia candida TaxID=158441 RepID=UPI000B8FD840|nr:lipase 3 [Folsomia candida]
MGFVSFLVFAAAFFHVVLANNNDADLQKIFASADFGMIPSVGDEVRSDANLTVPEIIAKYGYPIETHSVFTEDGYILQLHRIPYGRNCGPAPGKKPVFVQHGLLCDSSNFVITGVNKGLAYLLADSCYDVWLGNARGNTYSRRHITLSPDTDKEAFWDFSWNEMGIYDLPANFDHILAITGAEKLYYIGHSMGTTMFFVCMTERPEYNSKVALMSALAPVAFTQNMISPLRFIAPFSTQIEWLLEMIGLHEFAANSPFYDLIGATLCNETNPWHEICTNVLFLLCGFDPEQMDPALTPEILGQLPAGTSVRTIVHYAQGVTSGQFQKYDFGEEKNLLVYGSPVPPVYDWTKMTAPVALYWAQNDWLGVPDDTLRVMQNVVNLQRFWRINFDKFNHLDFLFALDLVPFVNRPVLEFLHGY